MIRARALREIVTLYTVTQTGTEDRYGNAADEESEGVEVAAAVTPQSEQELEVNEETMISKYSVIVGPDAVLDGLSRVEWRARSFEVIGQPKTFAQGRAHHQEFVMREIR